MEISIREIVEGLQKPGKSKQGLAAVLGRAPTAVTSLLKGTRAIKQHEVSKIREYLELRDGVRIVGDVGAGSEAHFYGEASDPPHPDETVPAPAGASPDTVAVTIRGTSLGTAYNGWVAFYDDRRDPITDDLIGHLCVVGLSDGRVLIKTPKAARQRGRFHLISDNDEPIMDVKITWAARVIGMAPRR